MTHGLSEPSAWVRRFAPLIPHGQVLDLACGSGRHARLLASLGLPVLAVDRDAAVLASWSALGVDTRVLDLEQHGAELQPDWPLQPARFSGVVVTNYLYRPLLPSLLSSVASDGVLIYETFAVGNGQFGKPSNPDFLLAPGELLQHVLATAGWHVIAFEDGYTQSPKPAMVQRICARRMGAQAMPSAVAL